MFGDWEFSARTRRLVATLCLTVLTGLIELALQRKLSWKIFVAVCVVLVLLPPSVPQLINAART